MSVIILHSVMRCGESCVMVSCPHLRRGTVHILHHKVVISCHYSQDNRGSAAITAHVYSITYVHSAHHS